MNECSSCQQVLQLVLGLPGAHQMDTAAVCRLGNACVERKMLEALGCVLRLRGALGLSVEQVKPWLRHLVGCQSRDLVQLLAKLPAVGGSGGAVGSSHCADVEVQLLLAGMEVGEGFDALQ